MKNRIGTLLLSLVVAFGLWAYVITNVSIEETSTITNIPIIFQNEGALTGRNLMLTAGTEQTVTLTVTGNRSEVLKLNSNNVSVVVDLSRIYDAGRQSVSFTVSYPADVNTNVISYVADKSRIALTVENKIDVTIPVVIEYTGTLAEGYRVDKDAQYIDRTEILVTGPESVVSQMAQARIEVSLEGVSETLDLDCEYILCDAEGVPVEVPNVDQVVVDAEMVYLRLPVQAYKIVPFELNVTDGGGATKDTTSIVFEPAEILIAGSDEALAGIESIVLDSINLADLLEDEIRTYEVVLPAGVENLSELETVTVTISFPELVTQTFTITNENIEMINVPGGLIPKVWTSQVSVTVRGPRDLVLAMTADDIKVQADFSNMKIGQETREATVTIDEAYSGVGIITVSNKVQLTLEEPVPETTGDPEAQAEDA